MSDKAKKSGKRDSYQRINFREAQAKNRRRTFVLIFGFILFFLLVGAVFGAAFAPQERIDDALFKSYEYSPEKGLPVKEQAPTPEERQMKALYNSMLWGALISGGIAIIWITIGWLAGGPMTLAVSRAKKITQPKTHQEQQLFNVVQEMTVAAGLPAPSVHIIADTAMNAFACGRNPKVAAIAVTSGALEKLDREELQGVIGHEMAHIKNNDIMFMVMLMMLVGVLVIMCDIFLRTMFYTRAGGRSSGRGKGQLIMLIVGIILAIIAPIIARLIFFSVSREREYLADATSVELNRNPEGLMRALAKLSGDKEVLEVANRGTAPMFIVHPIKKFEARASSIFSTHPPIKERVARLAAMK